ncbi:MAG: hypothetical protein ABS34_10960 [Opitutaceae bacterium BACL24 MAG-120322-bin51]|nr:MAG: hypothetical protein ABS34_10960 [Opitutaceae bacterium BACL24 MAG-120322-bin51]
MATCRQYALVITAALSCGPLVYGNPAERVTEPSSVIAVEVENSATPAQPPERLYGTWTAKDVDADMGEVEIRLTFRREQQVTLMAWSDVPFVGQVRYLEGAYLVDGNTISSEAIREGKEAKFCFERKQLVLRFKSRKVVRFDRED